MSRKPSILVIEDESSIATMIQYNLEKSGFRIALVDDGSDAIDAVKDERPDLILLDWMLPGLSGIEICEKLRKDDTTRTIPIIMLTARGEEADRVKGLDTGADDFIVKPFSPTELVARINAVLRRIRPAFSDKSLSYEGLDVDMATRRVTFKKKPIKLGPTEFRLLVHFIENPSHIFSREQLLDAVWGHDIYVEPRTVDVHIRRLRKAMADTDPSLEDFIRTVRSAGYSLSKTEL
ncbi:MAG: phosphate regulon transcriptional regulatory protein PhoB [Proteobacteria bacterium]|nr:phosphate regulon transcriptional regulatory protein PhoB [Pseudomonadota bacterium]